MAATCIRGVDGSVTLPSGHAFKCRGWSLTVNQEANDCTGFTSTGDWRENLTGLNSWRGAASGYPEFDASGTSPMAAAGGSAQAVVLAGAGSIVLTAGTGCSYQGTVNVTSVSVGTSVDGNASIALEFTGTGALTQTWDVTP